jgi:hypothetical protein
MMIDVLEIEEKRKSPPVRPASPDDFAYRSAGRANPSVVVTDPTVSLYCLEPEARQALFVQVPEGVDLTAAPFMYLDQYEHAQRLFAVPYDTLHQLAAGIDLPAQLVFIYSTGRAGSTLLSKALGEIETVTSLSEPDVYTQAVALRQAEGQDDELRDLLASATRILFKPALTQGSAFNAVKFRSPGIEIADLLSAAFPGARNIFLYRDLAAYVRSATRAFGFDEIPPDARPAVASGLATQMPLLAEELRYRPDLSGTELVSFFWLSAVHAYARLRSDGMSILPVRYADMVADPPRTLDTILTYLAVPAGTVPAALRAFERDSQAGSFLSREEASRRPGTITDEQWESVRNLLDRYPIPPDTLPPESTAIPTRDSSGVLSQGTIDQDPGSS